MEIQKIKTSAISDNLVFISSDSGKTWIAREFIRKTDNFNKTINDSKQTSSNLNDQIYISKDSGLTWLNFTVENKILRRIIHA